MNDDVKRQVLIIKKNCEIALSNQISQLIEITKQTIKRIVHTRALNVTISSFLIFTAPFFAVDLHNTF
jgi:hypothetical protein